MVKRSLKPYDVTFLCFDIYFQNADKLTLLLDQDCTRRTLIASFDLKKTAHYSPKLRVTSLFSPCIERQTSIPKIQVQRYCPTETESSK